jgi:hypothetical protein
MNSWTFTGKETKKLTLNSEHKTDHPCASCYRHDHPLLVPNGEASSAHERLIREDSWIARLRNKTYIRSTIKRDEVETDRYPKIYKVFKKARYRTVIPRRSGVLEGGDAHELELDLDLGFNSRAVRVRVYIRQMRETTHRTVVYASGSVNGE